MIRNIIYIVMAIVLLGCLGKEDITDSPNSKVELGFSLEGESFTKDGSATSFENTIKHLDIYFFRADGTKILHERKNIDGTAMGSTYINGITLQELKQIQGNVTVCAVANSTNPQEDLANIQTYSGLRQTVETTTYLNITGYTGFEGDYPDSFLMTGETAKDFSAIDITENHKIEVVLYRAAAKVEIHFVKKNGSEHLHSFGEETATGYSYKDNSYYIRNLRYKTPFWGYATLDKRKTSPLTNSGYIVYNKTNDIDEVVVTTYIYSYAWGGDNASSIFEDAPFMIVNLPVMVYNEAGGGQTVYNNRNYYEIPLRVKADGNNTYKLERNHHYIITATVDAPGALTDMEPVELVPVHYQAYPWNSQSIDIGNDGTDVNYLFLNHNAIEMHNVSTSDQVHFASSSAIKSVILKRAYYINKYGKEIQVTYPKATFEEDVLNGKITVNSELSPTVNKQKIDNVVIYMTFEVTNQSGKSVQFTVTQYPTVYIQGVLGSFSYRTDFGANWADGRGSNGYISVEWKNNRWNYYSTHTQYTTFQSKKAGDKIDNNGQATMRYYFWERKGGVYNINYKDYHSGNPRMYHVTITSTDEEYHIGTPQLDENGYTDKGSDNLVSPSFMIASSLGAVSSFSNFSNEVAAKHCKEYAEAYYNSKNELIKLEDWRLPTSAEIKILVKYQQNSVAMDNIITGSHYMTASGGTVATGISGANSGKYVRCVRDEYKRPAK